MSKRKYIIEYDWPECGEYNDSIKYTNKCKNLAHVIWCAHSGHGLYTNSGYMCKKHFNLKTRFKWKYIKNFDFDEEQCFLFWKLDNECHKIGTPIAKSKG